MSPINEAEAPELINKIINLVSLYCESVDKWKI